MHKAAYNDPTIALKVHVHQEVRFAQFYKENFIII